MQVKAETGGSQRAVEGEVALHRLPVPTFRPGDDQPRDQCQEEDEDGIGHQRTADGARQPEVTVTVEQEGEETGIARLAPDDLQDFSRVGVDIGRCRALWGIGVEPCRFAGSAQREGGSIARDAASSPTRKEATSMPR